MFRYSRVGIPKGCTEAPHDDDEADDCYEDHGAIV